MNLLERMSSCWWQPAKPPDTHEIKSEEHVCRQNRFPLLPDVLYLRQVVGLPEAQCRTQLLGQWEPRMDDIWKQFLSDGAAHLAGR